jgi:hypothetical protein
MAIEEQVGGTARKASVALGVWLFVSAFLWQHTGGEFVNALVCGALTVVVGFAAMRSPGLRYVNAMVALWLFISSFAVPHAMRATVWNDVLVSIALFVLALVGAEEPRRRPLQPV